MSFIYGINSFTVSTFPPPSRRKPVHRAYLFYAHIQLRSGLAELALRLSYLLQLTIIRDFEKPDKVSLAFFPPEIFQGVVG